ncbi:hypothetical protein KRR40_36315 [Niabella defluvii]|nr:hypothetical protein KRR40_36315 [Niabella sp. I65]
MPQLLVIPTIDKKIDENGDLLDPAFEKKAFTTLHQNICGWQKRLHLNNLIFPTP